MADKDIESYKSDLTSSNSEETILATLADAYPTLDAGPGTPIYEMVVRPSATLFSKQAEGVLGLVEALDITDYDNIPEGDLNILLSRFFSYRRTGRYVSGIVRIVFGTQQDVTISAGDVFEASNNRVYEAVSDHFITGDTDLEGNYTDGYYYDIAVVSKGKGDTYNAYTNDSVSVKGSYSKYVRRAYFLSDTTDGGVSETNYTFYNRTKNGLAARNLFSYKSIKATLLENFPELQEVVPIGLRDEEMMRDIVPIPKYGSVHRGGMCDIYVRPARYSNGDSSTGYTPPLCFPLMYNGFTLADNPSALLGAWADANYHVTKSTYRGSSKEEIPTLSTGSNIRCLSVNLSDYDNFIEQEQYNLLHTDNLIRAMWVMVVTANITISSQNSTTDIAIVKQTVAQYINSMSSVNYPQIAEVAHLLLDAGIQEVRLPMEIRCYYLMPDLSIQSFGTGDAPTYPNSGTLLEPQEKDSLKFVISQRSEISLRTCCWYTNEDLIKVEVVN